MLRSPKAQQGWAQRQRKKGYRPNGRHCLLDRRCIYLRLYVFTHLRLYVFTHMMRAQPDKPRSTKQWQKLSR